VTAARVADLAVRVADLAVRVAGGVVALSGGVLVGVMSLLWVPWRVDTWLGQLRLPVSVAVAIAGVSVLLWFAPRATGTRWGVLLPAAGWFAVVMAALRTGHEGSRLLLPDDWVAALTLFGGTCVVVVGAVLAVTGGHRPLRPPAHPAADDK
jgi:hypothetical protein